MSTSIKATLGILLALSVIGCAGTREYVVQGQTPAAGADAVINIEHQEETSNWLVTVEVDHLLPPARYGDGLSVYAVWLREAEGQPERVGNLDYDSDDRVGTLEITTSLAGFELLITGESDANATTPSENVVIRHTAEPE